MKLYIFVLLAFTGCATLMPNMPGAVKETKSEYDGMKMLTLNPGWAGDLKLGAYKTSKMNTDEVFLIVRNDSIKNFDFNHPNLFIKIDGDEKKLSPVSKKTDCDVSSSSDVAHCTQHYKVKITFLEKLLNAKDVKIKLNLTDSFNTGNLDMDGVSTAKRGLNEFVVKAKAMQ